MTNGTSKQEKTEEKYTLGHTKLIFQLWSSYMTMMASRAVVTQGLAMAIQNKDLMTTSAFDTMSTYAQLASTFAKLIGGTLADYVGGKNTFTFVLGSYVLAILAIARAKATSTIIFAWTCILGAGALAWPSHAIISKPWVQNLSPSDKQFSISMLSTSSRSGAFLGSAIGAWLLTKLNNDWRRLSYITAFWCLGMSCLTYFNIVERNNGSGGKKNNATASIISLKKDTERKTKGKKELSGGEILKIALGERKIWLVYLGSALTFAPYCIANGLPVILLEFFNMPSSQIGFVSGLFPLVMVPSVVIGGSILGRLDEYKKGVFNLITCGISGAAFLFLATKPRLSLVGPTLAVAAATMVTPFFMTPGNFCPVYGGKYAGTFTGLVDLPGNILTTITLALYPTMKRIGGYPLIFRVYALMMFGTAICEYEFHRLESINPTVESPFD